MSREWVFASLVMFGAVLQVAFTIQSRSVNTFHIPWGRAFPRIWHLAVQGVLGSSIISVFLYFVLDEAFAKNWAMSLRVAMAPVCGYIPGFALALAANSLLRYSQSLANARLKAGKNPITLLNTTLKKIRTVLPPAISAELHRLGREEVAVLLIHYHGRDHVVRRAWTACMNLIARHIRNGGIEKIKNCPQMIELMCTHLGIECTKSLLRDAESGATPDQPKKKPMEPPFEREEEA